MPGLHPMQFRKLIITPTLQRIGFLTVAAEELVLGIAIQESGLQYLKQLGMGPALGLWQMEPASHDDIWRNFLSSRPKLASDILGPYSKPDADRMVWDLTYACAMCRIHLFRAPGDLPRAGDLAGQAAYWKRHYNTLRGAGTVAEYIANWKKVMG